MRKIDTITQSLFTVTFFTFFTFFTGERRRYTMKKKYVETRLPEEWKSCGVSRFIFSSKTSDDDVIHMIRVAFAHVYNFNRAEAALWFGRTY